MRLSRLCYLFYITLNKRKVKKILFYCSLNKKHPAINALQGLQQPCGGSLYRTRINLAMGTAEAPNGLTSQILFGLIHLCLLLDFLNILQFKIMSIFFFQITTYFLFFIAYLFCFLEYLCFNL